jgi:MinD-like ATPase involved in chromosome partitioning or flagellar assembly
MNSTADGRGRVLAVIGGRGGAGASVFAAAIVLAVSSSNEDTLLVDCDALGGGLDRVLGIPAARSLTLLAGPADGAAPGPDAVAAMIETGRQAGQTVICDLPRTFDDATLASLQRADLTVMIVPAEVRACAAAKILAARLADLGHCAKLVVRGPAPGDLCPDEVAALVGLPLLCSMRPEPSLARLIERGQFTLKPDNPLAKAARATLRALIAETTHAPEPAPLVSEVTT